MERVSLHFQNVNSLNVSVRNTLSYRSLKNTIRHIPSKPQLYFSYATRCLNIIHTKLRHNCILNYYLFRKNILVIESPKCACGLPEDSYHFFFVCTNYTLARNELFRCLLHSLNYLLLIVTYSYGVMKHKMMVQTSTHFPLFRNSLEIHYLDILNIQALLHFIISIVDIH